MIRGPLLFLTARGLRPVLVLWLAAVAAAVATATVVMPVDLRFPHEPRDVPIIELVAVLFAAVGTALSRPRLAEWEKLAAPRVVPAACAQVLLLAALAAAIAPLAALRLPDGVPWHYIPANAVVVAAAASLLCALLGPLAGSASTVALFMVAAGLQNLTELPVPLAEPDHPTLSPAVPAAALALALAATAAHRGLTTWALARARD